MNEEVAQEENKRRKANRDAAKDRFEGRTQKEEAAEPGADCSNAEDAGSNGESTRSGRRRNKKPGAGEGEEKAIREQAIEKHLAEINRLRRLCEEV